MRISVSMNGMAQCRQALGALREDLADKATVAGINKTIDKARTEMTRAITDEFQIASAEVRSRLHVGKANRQTLTADLHPFAGSRRGLSMNVIRFLEKSVSLAEARRRSKGGTLRVLRFRIKRGHGSKTIAGAFVGNRGRTVFVRIAGTTMASRSGSKGAAHREQIQAVQTVGVPQMFNTRRISERVLDRIRRELPVEILRAVRRFGER